MRGGTPNAYSRACASCGRVRLARRAALGPSPWARACSARARARRAQRWGSAGLSFAAARVIARGRARRSYRRRTRSPRDARGRARLTREILAKIYILAKLTPVYLYMISIWDTGNSGLAGQGRGLAGPPVRDMSYYIDTSLLPVGALGIRCRKDGGQLTREGAREISAYIKSVGPVLRAAEQGAASLYYCDKLNCVGHKITDYTDYCL
jgi:hypothetical protein